ncbi:hypothetical protein [uncultured Shewanella sp.]|uniref:hypothetical protein n=1 Tax=uncultured Shewanella sp. TaxID=173975 RepID=UPI0026157290|nr:hypothetical protein [uncultured Shewanella sp.]
MKQVRALLPHEFTTLKEAFKNHPKHRCGSINGLNWVSLFLYDSKRTGRPTIYDHNENQTLKELVDEAPYQLKHTQSKITLETEKTASKSSIKGILKKFDHSHKRARHSLKSKRYQDDFLACLPASYLFLN